MWEFCKEFWILILIGLAGGAVLLWLLLVVLPRSDREDRRTRGCARILECLDGGVTREQCDDLFPACTQTPEDQP